MPIGLNLLTERIGDVTVEVSRFPWWLQWAGQLGSLAAKLSPPPLPGSSVKISQHVTINITEESILLHTVCVCFLRGLLKSLKSCDVTQVFGFSVKLVFRRKRHTAIRIWCVLVPSRGESQNFVRMGSWGGGMLGDHLYASFGNITRGNRSTISFRDSFFFERFPTNLMTWMLSSSLCLSRPYKYSVILYASIHHVSWTS